METRVRGFGRAIVAVNFALATLAPTSVGASDAETVQRDVRTLMDAVHGGDVDTVLRLTHPRVVELQGGPASARGVIAAALAQLRGLGMKVETFAFTAPPAIVRGADQRTFAIVPTRQIMAFGNGQRVESVNFQFGVREREGAGWTYVEGSRLTPAVLGAWFPDFPPGYTLPAISRKKL